MCCTIKSALKQRIVWHFSMVIRFKHLYVTTDSSNYYNEKTTTKKKTIKGMEKKCPRFNFALFLSG